MSLRDEIDWIKACPGNEAFASEDWVPFIRAIRTELLDHIAKLADNPRISKTEFLFELSKMSNEWTVIKP